jgi:hypothetical protein
MFSRLVMLVESVVTGDAGDGLPKVSIIPTSEQYSRLLGWDVAVMMAALDVGRRDDDPASWSIESHVEPIETSGTAENRVSAIFLESNLGLPVIHAGPVADGQFDESVPDLNRSPIRTVEGVDLGFQFDLESLGERKRDDGLIGTRIYQGNR